MAVLAQGFNTYGLFCCIAQFFNIEFGQLFKNLGLLGFVGTIFGVANEALFGRDDVVELSGDTGGIGQLLAGVLEVNGHRGRLRRVTDRSARYLLFPSHFN